MSLRAQILRSWMFAAAFWAACVPAGGQAQTGNLGLKIPEVVIVGGDVPVIRGKRPVRPVPEKLPPARWLEPLSAEARVPALQPQLFEPGPPSVRRPAKPDDCYADVLPSGALVREEGAAAYFRAGYLAFLSNRTAEAEERFRAGLKANPDSVSTSFLGYWLGESLLRRKAEEQARAVWRRVADEPAGPYAGTAAYRLGLLAYGGRDYVEALKWMERVAARFPGHPHTAEAHLAAAELSLRMNDLPRASWHFAGARDAADGNTADLQRTALLRGGLTYYRLGRYEEAPPMLQAYLKLGGTDMEGLRSAGIALGWSHYFNRRYGEAVRSFREAAETSAVASHRGAKSEVLFGWLMSAVSQDEENEVRAAWDRFDADRPSGSSFLQGALRFAGWQFRKGRYRESAETIQKAIQNAGGRGTPVKADPAGLLARARLLLAHSFYNVDGQRSQAAAVFESLTGSGDAMSGSLPKALGAGASYGLMLSRLGTGGLGGAAAAADDFLTKFPKDGRAPDVHFWKGEALLRLNRLAEAREAFGKIPPNHAIGPLAALERAYTYYEEGLWKEAIPAFAESARLLRENPGLRAEAMAREADARYNTQDYIGAEELYRSVLKDSPAGPAAESAALHLGELRFHQTEYEEAEAAFSEFLRRWPKSSRADEAQYWKGLSRIRQGRFALARVSLSRLVRDYPKSRFLTSAQLQIGHAYYNEGRFDDAAATYNRVLSRNPSVTEAHEARYGIVLTQMVSGSTEKFIDDVREFIDKEPDSELVATLEFQVAEIYLAQRRHRDALASYVRVLMRGGQESDVALFRIGEIKRLEKKPDEAVEYFHDLLERFPESRIRADARYQLAESLEASGDCEQALGEYRVFLAQNPGHSLAGRARYWGGICANRLKNDDAAVQLFSEVLRSGESPELMARSRYELGRIEKKRGHFKLALEHIEAALKAGTIPNSGGELQFEVGSLRETLKQYPQAVVEYLKVIYLYPQEKKLGNRARLKVAGIYEKQGKFKQAVSLYRKVKKGATEVPVREQARKRLLLLRRPQGKSAEPSESRP